MVQLSLWTLLLDTHTSQTALLEGEDDWWTYFKWLSFFQLFAFECPRPILQGLWQLLFLPLHYLCLGILLSILAWSTIRDRALNHHCHQSYLRDIRFYFEFDLQVKLPYHRVLSLGNRDPLRRSAELRHYGVYTRLRVRSFSHHNYKSSDELPGVSVDRPPNSTWLEPPTDILDTATVKAGDHSTYGWNPYGPDTFTSPLDHLFDDYEGGRSHKDSSPRTTTLLTRLDPLELFRQEVALTTANPFMQSRAEAEAALLTRACVAAIDLTNVLNGRRLPSNLSTRLSGFLTEVDDEDLPASVPIVIDTGASISLTPNLEDFIGPLSDSEWVDLDGVGGNKVKIEGAGQVAWTIRDYFGNVEVVKTQALYCPDATIRLFSPQTYFVEHDSGDCHLNKTQLKLVLENGQTLYFPYQRGSNLPLMYTNWNDEPCPGAHNIMAACNNTVAMDEIFGVKKDNLNLSRAQKEVLIWHNRIAHAGCGWIQSLMRKRKDTVGNESIPPVIPTKCATAHKCDHPKCPACLLGKMHRRSPRTTVTHHIPETEMAIRRNDLKPGDCVSIDQFVSKVPGRLSHTFGKEDPRLKFNGGTMFADHASGYIFLNQQVSLRVGETLQGKHAFERMAALCNVKIKSFRADNHPFGSKEFREDLELNGQTMDLSGVGAHFQNGVVERSQLSINSWTRSFMVHQLLNWPEVYDQALWPLAMEQAVFLWNNLPRKESGLSPVEIFTGTKNASYDALLNAKVWGCPAYVLDPKLQDGKKLPKWKPRSRVGVYVGTSPNHASTVGRILSLNSGAISPQYHVVFDEHFATVPANEELLQFDQEIWDILNVQGHQQALDEEDLVGEVTPFQENFENFCLDNAVDDDGDSVNSSSTSVSEGEEDDDTVETFVPEGADAPLTTTPPGLRTGTRSGRKWRPLANHAVLNAALKPKPTQRAIRPTNRSPAKHHCYMAGGNPTSKVSNGKRQAADLHKLDWTKTVAMIQNGDSKGVISYLERHFDHETKTQEDWHPHALGAKASDADNPRFEEAMNGPDAEGYWDACKLEWQTLVDMKVWDVVKRQSWMRVLPCLWVLRCKRFPSGLIKKLKSRLVVQGNFQRKELGHFNLTWAPTVNWNTVRMILILTAAMGLASKQVDYTAAFVHAPIDRPAGYAKMTPEEKNRSSVFVEMPKGYAEPGHVLRLNKSLYGLKQAPRNFYQHLKAKLEKTGFTCAVDVDPCLFISENVICLVYVDDSIFVSRDVKYIDEAVQRLRDEGMALEEEDDVAGFLGVLIHRNDETKTVTLTQRGLIDRILEALDVSGLPPVSTPADEVLGTDPDGDPCQCTFNYPSVIGMLWYLYGHSRPDLGFAVSQAARFSFNPKRSHELALLRIGQYLKGTIDQGLTFTPSSVDSFKMDVYVDSDFMGLYGKEARTDPTNVKSRTGFVVCINDCPIIWSSKLQETIALSTMMAEYYALSTAMREVLPLRALVKTIAKGLQLPEECLSTFNTTIWEDNMGALTLANLEPGQNTARSKFYDVKVHWFRSHMEPNQIEVKKIDTAVQLADIFTKPLTKDQFEAIRKLVMGW